ncbi:MAG TPA: MerR family transcriptional regulator [Gaiellales bacterium]|nr:MerR family transcriptional regulator [Gaiellales bacterium]
MTSPQFRIGELARRVGTTPRAVRYYEQLGLLPGSDRSDGAHRVYDEHDEARLRDLLRVRELLGLTLVELREWMDAEDARARLRERWNEQPSPDERTRADIIREAIEHMDRQLSLVRSRLGSLEQLEDELAAKRRRVRSMLAEIEQGQA